LLWAVGGFSRSRSVEPSSYVVDVIYVRPVPAADEEFSARVRAAVGRIAPGSATGAVIAAPSEDTLRRALSDIRRSYPDVWIRQQDPLVGGHGGTITWYAFRDEAPGLSRRLPRRLR
jgi:hypothetical protein